MGTGGLVWLDFSGLLSPAGMVIMVLLFLGALFLLLWKRKVLTSGQKMILLAVLVISMVYLMLLLWLAIGFGRGPLRAPTPY